MNGLLDGFSSSQIGTCQRQYRSGEKHIGASRRAPPATAHDAHRNATSAKATPGCCSAVPIRGSDLGSIGSTDRSPFQRTTCVWTNVFDLFSLALVERHHFVKLRAIRLLERLGFVGVRRQIEHLVKRIVTEGDDL